MAIVEYSSEEIRKFRDNVVLDLWVNKGLSVPDIAMIVRIEELDAKRVINEATTDALKEPSPPNPTEPSPPSDDRPNMKISKTIEVPFEGADQPFVIEFLETDHPGPE